MPIEDTCPTPDSLNVDTVCPGLFCTSLDWGSIMAAARFQRNASLLARDTFVALIKAGAEIPGEADPELVEDAALAVGQLVEKVKEYEGGPGLGWVPSVAEEVLAAAKRGHCAGVYFNELLSKMGGCDPLENDCPPGFGCYLVDGGWRCQAEKPGDAPADSSEPGTGSPPPGDGAPADSGDGIGAVLLGGAALVGLVAALRRRRRG